MRTIFEMDVKERWKRIKGWPYSISNHGRIKRIKSGPRTFIGKILNGRVNKRGYLQVILCENGKRKSFRIHRLVAGAFFGSCPEGKEVNHKDGNKLNNYVDNLEYVTSKENINHAIRLGLKESMEGEKNLFVKLTEKNVVKIRKMYETKFYTQKEIAKKFKISETTINKIVNYKTWKYI